MLVQGGTDVLCCNPSQHGTQSLIVLSHFRLCCVATRRNRSLVKQSLPARHTIHHCSVSFQAVLCHVLSHFRLCCVDKRRNRSLVLQSLSAWQAIHHCTLSYQAVLCCVLSHFRLCFVTTRRNGSLVLQSLPAQHTVHHYSVSFQAVLCRYKDELKSCVAIPPSTAHNPSLYCVISGYVVSLQGGTEVLCCNPSQHNTQSITVLCHFRLCCVTTRRNRSLVLQSLSAQHTIHHCTESFQAVLCHYKEEQKSCVAIRLSTIHNPSLY